MIAVIAFVTTGFLVATFGLSAKRLSESSKNQENFWLAYVLLAVVFFIYGISAAVDQTDFLPRAVLIGNFFIFFPSMILVADFIRVRSILVYPASAVIGLVLTASRAAWFYPQPEVVDGLLFFHTQAPVGILVAALFAFVWLPANLRYSETLAKAVNLDDLYLVYSGLFTFTITSAVFFLASTTSLLITISFAAISAGFAALALVNILTIKFRRFAASSSDTN